MWRTKPEGDAMEISVMESASGGQVTITAEDGAFRVTWSDGERIYADMTCRTLRRAQIEAANFAE